MNVAFFIIPKSKIIYIYENNTLRPINGIKRCELAAVLRTFCQTMLDPAQG